MDNKLINHFGDSKTKVILFDTKHKLAKVSSLDIRYGTIHINQYYTVTYFDFSLDGNLSGLESY